VAVPASTVSPFVIFWGVRSLKPDAAAQLVVYRHSLERIEHEAAMLEWEIGRLRKQAEAA
jgi:hypothetical protein